MSDIKKELIDFETHCFETGQLQVGELMSTTIMHIAELEKELPAPKGFWVTSKDLHVWQLEQQAKGIEDALSSVERYYLVDRYWIDVADLRVKAIDLQVEAKALKEGV
jgi:hypothetical protein